MDSKYSPHRALVQLQSERQIDLLSMRGQPYRGLRRFISTMALMTSPDGVFGPAFLPP